MTPAVVRGGVTVILIGMLGLLAACAPEPIPTSTAAAPTASPVPVATVEPTATPEPEPTPGLCDAGSLVAIWAHYDDDLIFGHTRVAEALDANKCVTIAYLSAGDAGRGLDYSLGREQGIRNAYDTLRGYDGQWNESADVLETGVTVEEWTPVGDPRLQLLSFRLVDGNIDGSGFESMGYESLAKLAAGTIPTVRDVDGPQQLTRDDITHSLVEIIGDADPDAVLTGMPQEAVDLARGDHSDHSTTASFARAAWRSMDLDAAAVTYAIGYQTSDYPVNVEGDELARKVAAFSAYAVQDPVTANCRDLDSCLNLRLFGGWLQREYSKNATELDLG
ncbi:hypothetical protein ASD65_04045 [Microbacterium sp. Root61]|uniref:PIG-L family deacetylase n=1 Tax=Microbacterium sp. Root61 TaxID=1736570 RepID=UPI0006FB89B6|nr:PIG-L family deacetylase [Microbacterium sp. Root61]KRA23689.1 hypothetical protein ASD65_04045 [Microbacterium sp. Root61]